MPIKNWKYKKKIEFNINEMDSIENPTIHYPGTEPTNNGSITKLTRLIHDLIHDFLEP